MKAIKKFAFVFSQVHLDFRIAEFESICSLFDIQYDQSSLSVQKHVQVLEFDSVECVRQILSRSMLIHSAIELLSHQNSYEELYADLEQRKEDFQCFNSPSQSFAIRVRAIGKKRDHSYCSGVIDKLGSILPLGDAPVDLVNTLNTFTVVEVNKREGRESHVDEVYFGRLVGNGQSKLKSDYNLPDRCYIGNTTMDPELSFIQANLVKADASSLVLDPFCGTCGLLIAAAHFGSHVVGTEINYQIARAVGKSSRVGAKYRGPDESVAANFLQYGLNDQFVALMIADASQHAVWRPSTSGIFDAIVTDPPYGVREKGTKVGNKQRKPHWTLPGSTHEQHYPEKAKYEISSVFLDILDLAASVLVLHGRVSFWFPVFDDQYSDAVLPKHNALTLVVNCEQRLAGKYSRRLLVYEKIGFPKDGEKAYVEKDCYKDSTFRERIFLNNT